MKTISIDLLIESIQSSQFRVTDHADEEAQADQLLPKEVLFSAVHGEIIEPYPDDKPYPSCLIFGQLENDDPVHSVWAYNEDSQWAVLINCTVLIQRVGLIGAKGEPHETFHTMSSVWW